MEQYSSLSDIFGIVVFEMIRRLGTKNEKKAYEIIFRNLARDMNQNRKLSWFKIESEDIEDKGISFIIDFYKKVIPSEFLVITYVDILGKSGITIDRFKTEEDVLSFVDTQSPEDPKPIIVSNNTLLEIVDTNTPLGVKRVLREAGYPVSKTLKDLYQDDLYMQEDYWDMIKEDKILILQTSSKQFTKTTQEDLERYLL
ncbi:hypothetical protein [Sinanaerobacter sp. ZZT-01]|uniref:hypothetical protein n=1 Tax=Sinanaerobacter sp. ZZT-01 TaxID=3111540 RepID=UPI002D79F64D|nr:hypothetical protein [Sinanaerobacter sp. ZZT-01]WRR92675.1 hypothetical protein U5921_11560 [Sinanaerobacter sp. ZZT-01]